MNGYSVSISVSNYIVTTDVMAEDSEQAFEQALYTLINSDPKIDLFDKEVRYETELIEEDVL